MSSAAGIIAFNEGLQEPALVVALALAFIVILDASSLRQGLSLVILTIRRQTWRQPRASV